MKIIFYERLNELMEEKQISALALSKIVDVNETTILRWKKGLMLPTIDKIILLCNFFSVTADYLIGIDEK